MIALANEEFAIGLKLAGIKESYYEKAQISQILKSISSNEIIISTIDVVKLFPQLEDFPNLIVFPAKTSDFLNLEDLKKLVQKTVGSEVQL